MDNQGPKFGGAAALGAAESNAASASLEQHEDNLDGVREAETSDVADINYTGGGREEESGQKSGIFSGKKGPIATIIGIFLAVAGIVGGSQLMQPFSLAEQLRVAFNSMQTSVSVRSNVLFKYQLGRDVNNPVKYEDLQELDKWALMKLNQLIKDCTKAFDEYDFNEASVDLIPTIDFNI